MTRTNAAGVITAFVRATALYVVASTIVTLPIYLGMDQPLPGITVRLVYGPPLLTFAIAAALWSFADVIVKLALLRGDQPPFESTLDVDQWQRVAFSAIGVLMGGNGVVGLFGTALTWARLGELLPERVLANSLADGALRIAVGAALLFGARGLVGMVERVRRLGHRGDGESHAGDV
jgi:hypothetical protein